MKTKEEIIWERCQKMMAKKPTTYNVRTKISPTRRKKIYARDGYKCLKCRATENLTIDHIVPASRGGVKRKFNLQTLCKKCNEEKGDMIICYL